MRLIDADALIADCQLAQKQADRHGREYTNAFYSGGGEVSTEWWCVEDMIENAPTIEPEQRWIPVTERLPEERDSIFAKLYGTEKWRNAMFRKTSNTVIITVEFKDGTRQTAPCHTIDGEWNQSIKGVGKVLAWMPLPDPYKDDPCNGCDYLGESCVGEGCGKLTERKEGEAE